MGYLKPINCSNYFAIRIKSVSSIKKKKHTVKQIWFLKTNLAITHFVIAPSPSVTPFSFTPGPARFLFWPHCCSHGSSILSSSSSSSSWNLELHLSHLHQLPLLFPPSAAPSTQALCQSSPRCSHACVCWSMYTLPVMVPFCQTITCGFLWQLQCTCDDGCVGSTVVSHQRKPGEGAVAHWCHVSEPSQQRFMAQLQTQEDTQAVGLLFQILHLTINLVQGPP